MKIKFSILSNLPLRLFSILTPSLLVPVLSSHRLQALSVECPQSFGPCLSFPALATSVCSRVVDPHSFSALCSCRSCFAGTSSRFVLEQLVGPLSFPFQWCKTSQLLSSLRWSQRSYESGMLSYRLPVLCPAGKIDRLPCFGKYHASRVHTPNLSSTHGTKASIFVLPKFFLSLSNFSELCWSF